MASRDIKERLRERLRERKEKKEVNICALITIYDNFTYLQDCVNSMVEFVDSIIIVSWKERDLELDIKLPWKYFHANFVNFAQFRNEALKLALKEFPLSSHFLLSEANYIWTFTPGTKAKITNQGHYIQETQGSLSYYNTNLISPHAGFCYYGYAHCSLRHPAKDVKLECLDGVNATIISEELIENKLILDEKLLKEGIKAQDGLKSRYYFYLGQTLRSIAQKMGQPESYQEAIRYYQKRVKAGGWEEEIYYAKYQIGYCYEMLEKNQEATAAYMEAYEYRKTRAEALYNYVRLQRLNKNFKEALSYAFIGKHIALPKDVLFLERDCYEYLFDYEIFLCAYYVDGLKNFGKVAGESILKRAEQGGNVNEEILENIKKNQIFYQ